MFLKIPDEKDTRHKLAAVFILNIYYEITATDMLGNVSVFSFVNVKEPVATATVDETEAGEELVYGRDSIITKTEYASVTSVLIKTANGNVTYNFDYTRETRCSTC